MKKLITLLLGILLLVNIVACAAPVEDTGGTATTSATTTATQSKVTESTMQSITSTTQSNTSAIISATASSNSGDDAEGQGGYDIHTFNYANDYKFSGIGGEFFSYARETFGDQKLYDIRDELVASKKANPYAYVGGSTQFWMHRLNIPREKFVELNNVDKEFYKDLPWFLENHTFTDEEIDDIYNLTTEEFNQKYKAPTAVVVGEVIYSFDWFHQNNIDLWQKQSFTVAQLQEAVDNAKKMENFPQGIAEAVEKKLNDYIAAVGAQAVE